MDSEGPAQAFEMPFNMSDYINFDEDVDTFNPTKGSSPRSSVAEPPQDMVVEDSYVGFDDADEAAITGVYESPDGNYALGLGFDATEVASAETGETGAAFCDSVTPSPNSQDSDMTDTFQTTTETNAVPHMFEPVASTNPAALNTPRSPSRWYPVSSQLHQQLNALYAPQLRQFAADPNPPPVLYLPAEGPSASPMPSTLSTPSDDLTQTDSSQTLRLNAEDLSIDPSLLVRTKVKVLRSLPSPSGTFRPILPTTDSYVSDSEDAIFRPMKKRTLDVNDSSAEPATKRAKTARPPTTAAVENMDSNEEDDAEMARAQTPEHELLPNVVKDEHSVDASEAESDDIDSSDLSSPPASPVMPPSHVTKVTSDTLPSSPAPKQGPNWRYEQAIETLLRNKRRKEWNRRRTNGASAEGEAPNRKMQKLLGEIEDSVEFAEARGYEVGGRVDGDEGVRRSTRRGARKNYAGLE